MNEEQTLTAAAAERPPKPNWRQLLKTTEGRILLLGIASALAGLIVMGLIAVWSPQTSRMMGAMIFTDIILGMIVSMSIGYANGFGHALVIPVVMWVETVLVLLFYPVFVFSLLKLVEFPRLKYFLDRTHAAAERNHDRVRRYGVPGLFIFVWFPFWMTGPVLGSAVGYLLGFPAWLTLSVVLAGAYVTIVGWAYLLFDLYVRAAVFGSWAPILIIGLIIVVIFSVYLLDRRGKKHRTKESA
ncbi:MAG TPA: small multi-drug export protein [Gallionella sp.]|nr:small multi-drug export protein [Gallionella sp.]